MSAFVQDTVERAVKTAAQTTIGYFTAAGLTVLNADWGAYFALVGTATLLSVCTSLLSFSFGHSGTASLTDAVEPAEGRHAA